MEFQHDAPTITCYPSTFRSLDAATTEAVEDSRGVVYLLNADGTVPPSELETRVKACWNATFLFVVFQGKYRELRIARSLPIDKKTGKTYVLWEQSDVYEVFIGSNARTTRKYKEFQVSPDSRRLDIDVEWNPTGVRGNFDWVSEFRAKSFVDETRKQWDCVMEIPWRSLGAKYDTECEWNVNFYRAAGKYHGDELFAWSPVGRGAKVFHQPEKFGRMVFQR